MKNYYFISSPLHFFVASNLALENQGEENIAVLMAKNVDLATSYCQAIKAVDGIFCRSISFANHRGLSKMKHRKEVMRVIRETFDTSDDTRIYTGNDRRIEFQYAMHIASKSHASVSGIYIDDGAVSYIGHKSINSFAHRYLDPLLKKIVYGSWWKNALTTGTSPWIKQAYLAFPEHAHALLKSKPCQSIKTEVFSSQKFKALSLALLNESEIQPERLAQYKVLLTLPHEDTYKSDASTLARLYKRLSEQYEPEYIAVKAHPRSLDSALIDELFPGADQVDKNIGFELLLPLLDSNIVIMGDVSTTLLSTKWLRPDIRVEYLWGGTANSEVVNLFELLGIERADLGD